MHGPRSCLHSCARLQDLSNIGDVTVSFDPYTPTRVADANVTVARDASFAEIVSSAGDLRNLLSPGVIIRIGGEDTSAAGTLAGTNGEGYLDYPGGAGHRCDVPKVGGPLAASYS